MKPEIDYTLYLITDRHLMGSKALEGSVEEAIQGGCTVVQLREKNASAQIFYNTALQVKKITDSFRIPFIVNDRLDIALAVDADGVHVGQDDLPVNQARRLLGPDKILGVSARNLEEALDAVQNGADYLGVGAMNPTKTKTDAVVTSMEELQRIRTAISCPIVAIGGINKRTVNQFTGTGIDGVAVVSAVIGSKDVAGAAQELKIMLRNEVITAQR